MLSYEEYVNIGFEDGDKDEIIAAIAEAEQTVSVLTNGKSKAPDLDEKTAQYLKTAIGAQAELSIRKSKEKSGMCEINKIYMTGEDESVCISPLTVTILKLLNLFSFRREEK